MSDQRQQFVQTLEQYPHLARLLNHKSFVDKWALGDPLYCGHDLAWWLHYPSRATGILQSLEDVLASLDGHSGVSRKLRFLRNDHDWTWGYLVELYFYAALRRAGASFDLPEKGPDARIALGDSTLPIEVTALRRARWFPRLHERLDMLGERLGVVFPYSFESRTVDLFDDRPDFSSALSRVLAIAEVGVRTGLANGQSAGQIVLDDLALKLSWELGDEPLSGSGTLQPNDLYGCNLVTATLMNKARQLPSGQAGAVLIDTTNDEGHHVNAMLTRRLSPDWRQIPAEVTHVLLCGCFINSGDIHLAAHLRHPLSTFPSPSGLDELLGSIFRPPAPPQWSKDLPDLATLAAEEWGPEN